MAAIISGITYLQPMQCVVCGTIVQIQEKETTTVIVNAKGLPINSDTTEYEVKAVCPRCGKTYEVEKEGMFFRLENVTHKLCPILRLTETKEIGFGVEI